MEGYAAPTTGAAETEAPGPGESGGGQPAVPGGPCGLSGQVGLRDLTHHAEHDVRTHHVATEHTGTYHDIRQYIL